MLITFFRAIVLYIIVLVVMRLMGKREIGQLQPFELAISIMIADLASWNYTNFRVTYNAFNNIYHKYEKYKSKRNYMWEATNFNI